MRHLKFIILAIFAFALASCATGPKIDYDGISSNIQSGEMGGVIGGFNSSGLTYASMTLANVEDGSRGFMSFSSNPRVYSLKPGTYKIKSGSVGGYNVTGNMPLIGTWAENFEVKAGEVTNLGELHMGTITNNIKTSAGSKVLNALNSFGTNTNNDITHVFFSVSPMTSGDQAKAVEKFVGINEEQIVSRPLELRFTEAEFREAIDKASAKDADGKLPTKKEIQTKLAASLLMMMMESGDFGALLAKP